MDSDTFRPEDLIDYLENTSYSYENGSDLCCMAPPCNVNPIQGFAKSFLPPFYSLICLLGLLGNGMVIAVLLRAKEALPRTDIFILNLAVADILLVLTLPFWAIQELYGSIIGNFLCKLLGGIFKVNFYASIFFLVCISFDRYLSIVHVIRMYKRNKTSATHLLSLALWIFCFLLTLPDFIYLSTDFDSRQKISSCSLNFPNRYWKITLSFFEQIGAFFLPFLAMAYCYTHIIFTLLLSKGFHKYKALRVIFAVVAAFFLCWSPYHLVEFIITLIDLDILERDCEREEKVDIAKVITTAVGFFHCCLNPLLYAFIGVKFRNKFLDLLEKSGCVSQEFLRRYARPSTQRRDSAWSESTTFSGL
uniref:C-X-C chemokine receptor type 3 n=1 Tax=Pogona vitticeps TaxID=103695 RepID=A0A6J0V7I1_9SAUR